MAVACMMGAELFLRTVTDAVAVPIRLHGSAAVTVTFSVAGELPGSGAAKVKCGSLPNAGEMIQLCSVHVNESGSPSGSADADASRVTCSPAQTARDEGRTVAVGGSSAFPQWTVSPSIPDPWFGRNVVTP